MEERADVIDNLAAEFRSASLTKNWPSRSQVKQFLIQEYDFLIELIEKTSSAYDQNNIDLIARCTAAKTNLFKLEKDENLQ